jgi:peroxiredoxin
MKQSLSSIFFLIITNLLFAQSYKFTFNIKNAPNTICQLGYYRGDKTIVIDSVQVDSLKGEFSFKGDKKLQDGQYFVFLKGKGIIDFIVNKEYKQTFTVFGNELTDSIKVKGSKENEAYFEYLSHVRKRDKKVEGFRKTLDSIRQTTGDRKALNELEREVKESSKASQDFERKFIETHPNLLVSKIIKSKLLPIPPKNIPALGWDNKPNIMYHVWLNRHFWDDFDFDDNRLLYSRVYPHKLQAYFEQYSSARPDSISQSVDLLAAKCKQNKEVYQFCIDWILRQVEVRKTGGSDNVLVHLYDDYLSKDPSLTDPTTLERVKKKANLYRPNLINAIAPNFTLTSSKDSILTLSEIKSKYTVLYFTDLATESTAKTTIIADASMDYIGKGVEVVAITIEDAKDKWLEWANTNDNKWKHVNIKTTNDLIQQYGITEYPLLYILDENKKIVGKNIKAIELGRLLKIALTDKKK